MKNLSQVIKFINMVNIFFDHSEQNQCDQDECDHDDKLDIHFYFFKIKFSYLTLINPLSSAAPSCFNSET